MQATLIIAYYRKIQNLESILMALNNQRTTDFEVIVAEDDNNADTELFIKKNKNRFSFPILHIHQKKDLGFRKNEILNKAILVANTDKIIFIDGDCVPHKQFVYAYVKTVKPGYIFFGRRVFLDKRISEQFLKGKTLSTLNFLSLFFSKSRKKKEGFYFPYFSLTVKKRNLLGCNWGISKKHLMEVNGFDEDYIHAGVGEDVDIEWRLIANGLTMKSMKNKAILYHLYHPRTYSEEGVVKNYELLAQKKAANRIKCLNGIEKKKDFLHGEKFGY